MIANGHRDICPSLADAALRADAVDLKNGLIDTIFAFD